MSSNNELDFSEILCEGALRYAPEWYKVKGIIYFEHVLYDSFGNKVDIDYNSRELIDEATLKKLIKLIGFQGWLMSRYDIDIKRPLEEEDIEEQYDKVKDFEMFITGPVDLSEVTNDVEGRQSRQ
jgi:hypothetical protein